MSLRHLALRLSIGLTAVFAASPAAAQTTASASAPANATTDSPSTAGFTLPDSNRLRFTVDFLAGYGTDRANATLGFERQGRVGYATITAFGQLNNKVSYRIAINPITDTQPRPACGAPGFFYPNDPRFLYGTDTDIPCDPETGNRRVDAYRGVALDVLQQQGPIREAWIQARVLPFATVTVGRVRLPIGFDWQEAGSFTAKDATSIQRIDAQANFAALATFSQKAEGRVDPLWSISLAPNLGDTNRWWDYDYYYFEDGSFATNSQITWLLSLRASPWAWLDVRSSLQYGDTGSKVERRPSYWASKRNDDGSTFSVQVRPTSFARVLYEHASYVWGPRASSAQMLSVDPNPIKKRGFYTTAEGWWHVSSKTTIGASASYERIDRADSLIRFLASQPGFDVTMGQHDRMTVARVFVDLGAGVRIGFYRTIDHNPFPWVSGISAVTGAGAFQTSNTNKWGLMVRMQAR